MNASTKYNIFFYYFHKFLESSSFSDNTINSLIWPLMQLYFGEGKSKSNTWNNS